MSDLRAWILVLAGTVFATGLACGILVMAGLRTPPEPRGPFADYEALLVERLELDAETARGLNAYLREYHARLEAIQRDHRARFLSEMEPELAEQGRRFHDLVRNELLLPAQRAEFDRLSVGVPPPR